MNASSVPTSTASVTSLSTSKSPSRVSNKLIRKSSLSTCYSNVEGFNRSSGNGRLIRHLSLPSKDYVSEFTSLSLNDEKSIVRSMSTYENCRDSNPPSLDSDFESSFECYSDTVASFDTSSTISAKTSRECDSDTVASHDTSSIVSVKTSLDSDKDRVASIDASSIISGKTAYYTEDSFYSHDSAFQRPVKRRKFKLDSSEIDKMDIATNSSLKGTRDRRTNCKYFSIIIFIFLLLLLLGLLLMLVITICEAQNKEKYDFHFERNLTECLIGHEYTISVIKNAFHNFNVKQDGRVHFMWWVGPIGVGKSLAMQLIEASIDNSINVHTVVSSLLPKSAKAIERSVDNLFLGMDICKPNLIFIDGLDENEVSTVSKYLNVFFERMKSPRKNMFHDIEMRVLIVVIGNHNSFHITESYLKHRSEAHSTRQNYNYKDLQSELSRSSPFKTINYPLHFTTVPFLPLEFPDVEKCVIQQLNFLLNYDYACSSESNKELEDFVSARNLTIKGIQEKVMEVFRADQESISYVAPFGCKKYIALSL